MLVMEIEQAIKPLSREEKLELMQFITSDLLQDERLSYFTPGESHGFWSAHDEYKAAEQLQMLLKEHQS